MRLAQPGEHCSANAEAAGSNPVEAPKIFFSGYFRNCLNCDSLRWSHTHFICIPAVHIITFSELIITPILTGLYRHLDMIPIAMILRSAYNAIPVLEKLASSRPKLKLLFRIPSEVGGGSPQTSFLPPKIGLATTRVRARSAKASEKPTPHSLRWRS